MNKNVPGNHIVGYYFIGGSFNGDIPITRMCRSFEYRNCRKLEILQKNSFLVTIDLF